MMRKPSCLISWSKSDPAGDSVALLEACSRDRTAHACVFYLLECFDLKENAKGAPRRSGAATSSLIWAWLKPRFAAIG